jgi:thiosulfate dehydrogenase (quinone) large subunit
MGTPTRRDVLKTMLAAGAASLLPSAGCGGVNGPSGDIPAGNVASVPVGTLQGVPGRAVILGRDSSGLYAMTAICTHAGCDMESNGTIGAQGAFCACHGSVFDAEGNVVQGPARLPLQHFAVSVDTTGAITIHASQDVSETQRTPV